MKAQLADFYGNYASRGRRLQQMIKKLYEDTGYVIDTHTAVAAGVYDKYRKDTGDTDKDSDCYQQPVHISLQEA